MIPKKILVAIAFLFSLSLLPSAANSGEQGNFMIRVLGTGVLPDSSANVLQLPNDGAEVSDEFIPATTLTYFLNQNLALELFCCFAKHQAKGKGPNLNNLEIADFWIFPPSLTIQYHFTGMGKFKPYVGAGLTYINFFDEEATDVANSSVKIDDAFGFALQAGFDLGLGSGWYLNADVKKIWLDTEAEWRGATNLDADIDVDPLIVSAGLGYRFNLEDLFARGHHTPLK